MSAAKELHPEIIYHAQLQAICNCKSLPKMKDYLDSKAINYQEDAKGRLWTTVTWLNESKLSTNDDDFEL